MSTKQRFVITGANSGIGAELSVLHARQGDDVVMVNRSIERSRNTYQSPTPTTTGATP